jgi:hypothetical protein
MHHFPLIFSAILLFLNCNVKKNNETLVCNLTLYNPKIAFMPEEEYIFVDINEKRYWAKSIVALDDSSNIFWIENSGSEGYFREKRTDIDNKVDTSQFNGLTLEKNEIVINQYNFSINKQIFKRILINKSNTTMISEDIQAFGKNTLDSTKICLITFKK